MAYDFQKDVNDKINDAIDRIAVDHGVTRSEVLSAATQTLARHRDGSLRAAEPCVQACMPERHDRDRVENLRLASALAEMLTIQEEQS